MDYEDGTTSSKAPASEHRQRQLRQSKARSRKRSKSAPPPTLHNFFSTPTAPSRPADQPADPLAVPVANQPIANPQPSQSAAGSSSDPSPVETCSICFGEVVASALQLKSRCPLPCGHVFHSGCILGWSRSGGPGHSACPNCQSAESLKARSRPPPRHKRPACAAIGGTHGGAGISMSLHSNMHSNGGIVIELLVYHAWC